MYSTMLITFGAVASEQMTPAEEIVKKTLQLLDSIASYPNTILTYTASTMMLNAHINASNLIEPKVKIRADGYFYAKQ